MTLLCHCQGTSHKIAGSNSSKNEMSDVMLELSEPNEFQHEKLLMYLLIIKSILFLEVSLLHHGGFGELLFKNKPETGLRFFTFTWCLMPLECDVKALFPLQLCLSLCYEVYKMFVFIWSLFEPHFKLFISLNQLSLKTLFPCTLVPFLLDIFTILKRKGN